MQYTIAIDLDGTLAYYSGWKGIDHIGDPLPGSRRLVGFLLAEGYKVVIYTTRTNPEVNGGTAEELAKPIYAWLTKHGFDQRVTVALHGKPIAVMYIDDRAFDIPTNMDWGKESGRKIARIIHEGQTWSTRSFREEGEEARGGEMIVKLTYFKSTGKYYGDGTYSSELPRETPLYKFWDEFEAKLKEGERPGLIEGPNEFFVLIEVPGHPHNHPRMIIPTEALLEEVQRQKEKGLIK